MLIEGPMMKHVLWRCNLTEKVPFALQIGIGLAFEALRNEVVKGKSCREGPL